MTCTVAIGWVDLSLHVTIGIEFSLHVTSHPVGRNVVSACRRAMKEIRGIICKQRNQYELVAAGAETFDSLNSK